MTEIELIEKAAIKVGIKSLLNHGAASCVFSEGCNGVSQEHLVAFAREVALHCAVHLAQPPIAGEPVADEDEPRDYDAEPCMASGWLCQDEGCPQHGTKHVCVERAAPQPAQTEAGEGSVACRTGG